MRPSRSTRSWRIKLSGSLLQAAVERKLEVAGEALNKLRKADPVTAERIPHVHKVIGMRNVLIHGYAEVDPHQVWVAATEDVPNLIEVLDALLAEASSAASEATD
ncbi:MAG: DUF86 domain-containing protein [Nocardioides sp.]|uniref:HepT-like ribonuclease domain-containing protein n=1 Tax=Nocardioides sp. TaxID=35761 RepID=UPI0039E4008E